jgi:hypothetical protein
MITKPTTYTADFVLEELKTMLNEIKENKDIVYKGEVFENKAYSRQRFSEWASAFKDNQEISDTIKKIDEILETRAVKRGIDLKGNSSFLIFHLKNNYGWRDKQELEHTGANGGPIQYTDTERAARIAALVDRAKGREKEDDTSE